MTLAEILERIFIGAGYLCVVCSIGAAFTLGCALVGRLLKWAPVSLTVHVYQPNSDNGENE